MCLFRCNSQAGLIKVWRDDNDGDIRVMFQKERDMALAVIVGVQSSIARISFDPLKIMVEELSPDEWQENWRHPRAGYPLRFRELFDCFVPSANGFDPNGGAGGSNATTGGNNLEGSSEGISSNNRGDAGSSEGGIPSEHDTPSLVINENARRQSGEDNQVMVELLLRGSPGENITAPTPALLYLMNRKEHRCSMKSSISLCFTQFGTGLEKSLQVTINTTYNLPHEVALFQLRPAHRDTRVGVLHDELMASYKAENEASLPLVEYHAIDLSTVDVSDKTMSSSSAGICVGLNAGAPSGIVRTIVSGLLHKSRGKSKKVSQSLQFDGVRGTGYQVSYCQLPGHHEDVLSYIAQHPTPLKMLGFEDSGLSLYSRRNVSTMGKTTALKFTGKFWIMNQEIEKHIFEANRLLGEFSLRESPTKRKNLISELHTGAQRFSKELLVNHGFQWEAFAGQRFRRVFSDILNTHVPDIEGSVEFE